MDKELKDKVLYHGKGLAINLPLFIFELIRSMCKVVVPIILGIGRGIVGALTTIVVRGCERGAPKLTNMFRK